MSIIAFSIFTPIPGMSEIDILDMAEAYVDEPVEFIGPHEEDCPCDLCYEWQARGQWRWLNATSARPCYCSDDQLHHVGCDCGAEDDRYTDEQVQAAYKRHTARRNLRHLSPDLQQLRQTAFNPFLFCDCLPDCHIPF